MRGFFVIVLTALALGWLGARAGKAKAHEVDSVWYFPPIREVQVLCSLVCLLGIGLAIWGIFGPASDRGVMLTGGTLIVLFSLLIWPKEISVSADGVSQRDLFGREKTIGWEDVVACNELKQGVTIRSATGSRITLSEYHADRPRFVALLQQHLATRNSPLSASRKRRFRSNR